MTVNSFDEIKIERISAREKGGNGFGVYLFFFCDSFNKCDVEISIASWISLHGYHFMDIASWMFWYRCVGTERFLLVQEMKVRAKIVLRVCYRSFCLNYRRNYTIIYDNKNTNKMTDVSIRFHLIGRLTNSVFHKFFFHFSTL